MDIQILQQINAILEDCVTHNITHQLEIVTSNRDWDALIIILPRPKKPSDSAKVISLVKSSKDVEPLN